MGPGRRRQFARHPWGRGCAAALSATIIAASVLLLKAQPPSQLNEESDNPAMEARIDALLRQMTLEEKPGNWSGTTRMGSGAAPRASHR